jgi:hypothetical protein
VNSSGARPEYGSIGSPWPGNPYLPPAPAPADFGYSSLPGSIFSAYFGSNAGSLYNAMANLQRPRRVAVPASGVRGR